MAVHDMAEVQDTADNIVGCAPAGLALLANPHVDPFQLSASVTRSLAPSIESPTAVQTVGDAHETAETCCESLNVFGMASMTQLVPVQPSARVRWSVPMSPIAV